MDRGRPQLNSTTLKVNISVVDANDNNPTFKRPSYSASVSENAALGTLVLQVNATEKDSGLLSKIGYNISAGDALGFFDIEYYSVGYMNMILEGIHSFTSVSPSFMIERFQSFFLFVVVHFFSIELMNYHECIYQLNHISKTCRAHSASLGLNNLL